MYWLYWPHFSWLFFLKNRWLMNLFMNSRINSQLFHTFFKKNICTKNWNKVTDASTQSLISFLVFFYYLSNLRRPFIYDLPSKIDISSAFSLRKISFCQCIVHVQQQPASGPSGISYSSFQAWMILATLMHFWFNK